jgi:hypothetical protein
MENKSVPQPLRLLSLRFPNIPLRPHQIPWFRGGVAESAGLGLDIFHNHGAGTEGLFQRPALIQYRVAHGCACLWGMGEGAKAIERWWLDAPDALTFGGRTYPLQAAEVHRHNFQVQMAPDWKYYRLHDYLALNRDNYEYWLQNHRLIDRTQLLEKVLTGHLLGFCEAAGFQVPDRSLEAQVVDIHKRHKSRFHGVDLMAFELTYRTNLILPDAIALGKAVSHGFGVQWPVPRFEETVPVFRKLQTAFFEMADA